MPNEYLFTIFVATLPSIIGIVIASLRAKGVDEIFLIDPALAVLRFLRQNSSPLISRQCPDCEELYVQAFMEISILRTTFLASVGSIAIGTLCTTILMLWNKSWAFITSGILSIVLIYFCFSILLTPTIYSWWRRLTSRFWIFLTTAVVNVILLVFTEQMSVIHNPLMWWSVLTDPHLTEWMLGLEFPFWVIPTMMVVCSIAFSLFHYAMRGGRRGLYGSVRNHVRRILQEDKSIQGGTAQTWTNMINQYHGDKKVYTVQEVEKTLNLLLYEGKLRPDITPNFELIYSKTR